MAAQAAEVDERLGEMRQAMAKLPQEMRETLELRLADDLSYEEIAAVLEIPVGTVRSRLHNAVKKLREEMCHE
jgi:RNA polymerase sigma-70 factor, ECF subfamily